MSRTASLILTLLLAAATALSLALPWTDLAALFDADPALGRAILVELRLPRTLLALVYGAMLAAAGAAIQALFANPLASPDLTGTTSGAALGAVVTAYILGFSGPLALSFGAVAGALGALLLLLALAGPRAETATLLLAGLAISALAGALTTLALALAPSPFAFYDAYDWLMGSLVDRSLAQAAFAGIPAALAILLLLRLARPLDALALGEEVAESLGHDIVRLRRWTVCLTAFGVGACVAICGAIGFVGLVAPIFARRLTGGHPGRAIWPAAMIGALLLAAADVAVRAAPLGRTLPIGVLTALLGAPFFLWLVANMRWRIGR
ncbi:MAG TPA: iron chelate uptake ABC transporter family permease subunit [Allosphingosinicella sp.]|jgi:iron complex transport system permease protein